MTTNGYGSGDLVQIRDLKMHFPVTKGIILQRQVGAIKAVDGVSFNIKKGETHWSLFPNQSYGDFEIEIDLFDSSDNFTGDISQGLIVREKDDAHFYAVLVDLCSSFSFLPAENVEATSRVSGPIFQIVLRKLAGQSLLVGGED